MPAGLFGWGYQPQQAPIKLGGGSPAVAKPAATDADGVAAALRASTRADPSNHVPGVSLLKEFLEGPHTGPADEAVVGVEVIDQAKGGAVETRRCSGLLLRCDGFFLLPPAFTSLDMSGGQEAVKQTVRVTVHPGTPKAVSAFAYIRHYIVPGIDMTVMKLQDVHAPAARPLMPASLKPGDDVELVWTEWDAAAGGFTEVRRRKAKLGTLPAEADQKRLAWHTGEIPFTETLEGVPGGATVVGPEGMAVGTMPGSTSRHDRFTSFSVLERITNCVIAAPTTDTEFARLQQIEKGDGDNASGNQTRSRPRPRIRRRRWSPATRATSQAHPVNDMVDIPGGPLRVPSAFVEDQRDLCGETIVCVSAFKIDRYKVSNREYYKFWLSIPKSERAKKEVRAALYPLAWAVTEPPFPAELDDVPVLGVPISGARAYAQSKGKRLPTTYEWARAVFGVYGDEAPPAWLHEYARDRQATWARIVAAHEQYYAAMMSALQRRQADAQIDQIAAQLDRPRTVLNNARFIPPPQLIPFLDPRDEYTAACLWSQKFVNDEVKRLCDKWIDPLYILPAGSRPYGHEPLRREGRDTERKRAGRL